MLPLSARRRALMPAIVVAALALALSACMPLNTDEQLLSDRTNAIRTQAGLPTLYQHDILVSRAREIAADLAARGVLQHSDLSEAIVLPFEAAGENIGRGSSARAVTESLVASKPHRANMVHGAFTHQGVGTAVAGNGTVYVVQLFCRC